MKRPFVVGLLSVFPGLGFITLGKILPGIVSFAIVAFFAILGYLVPWETFSITCYTLALIAWISQIYVAVRTARGLVTTETGLGFSSIPVASIPLPPDTSREDKNLNRMEHEISQLLLPGEHVMAAIEGIRDAPPLASNIFDMLLSLATLTTVVSKNQASGIYIAVTDQDLIIANRDSLGKPSNLERFPLTRVRLIKSNMGVLTDEIIIDIGEKQPLRVNVGRRSRQGTWQLVRVLLGVGSHQSVSYSSDDASANARQISPGMDQAKKFILTFQGDVPIRTTTFLLHGVISAIFMLIGYAAAYGAFHNGLIVDQWTKEIVGNISLQLICCSPLLLTTACAVGILAMLAQSHLKLSALVLKLVNGIISIIIGIAVYLPFQLLLIIGAAF